MTNKIVNNPDINFRGNRSYHYENKNLKSDRYVQPQQIFQPPAFLFQIKNESSSYNKKKSYETLNGFRPKLESKSKRGDSSSGFRFNNFQKKADPSTDQKMRIVKNKLKERFDYYRKNESKLHGRELFDSGQILRIKPIENQECETNNNGKQGKGQDSECSSPYLQFSSNWFPKKEPKSLFNKVKNFYSSKSQIIMDINHKVKQNLEEKIAEIQLKYKSQYNSNNPLEIMTIFSIKEQERPLASSFKKKREIVEPLDSPNKREHQQKLNHSLSPNRPKKKEIIEIIQAESLPDVSADKVYAKKIKSFVEFVTKVNYSNNFLVNPIKLSVDYNSYEKIKVYVGNGNNKYLIIALLKRRFWYEITKSITKDTKFIWTQNSLKEIHNSQQIQSNSKQEQIVKIAINNDSLFSTSSIFTASMSKDSQKVARNITNQLNFKYCSTDMISQQKIHKSLKNNSVNFRSRKKKIFSSNDFNEKLFMNREKAERIEQILEKQFAHKIKYKHVEIKQQNPEDIHVITNHIPHNTFIASKKALFYTMEHYYKNIKKVNPFEIIPKTYHFKSSEDENYSIFLEQEKKISTKSIWIVKPGECTNRGNGITIMRASQISKKILKKEFHGNGQQKTTIVQKYITDPLLYNGRKFDIRHYMMISVINGNLKAYWYSQGYLRTSSQLFSLEKLDDIFIHLTNDAIQQNSQNYGKYQPGNKLSYNQFQRYLDQNHPKKQIDFKANILGQMKSIATDVIKANWLNLDRNRRMNNFEIFGLDFMIDSKFRPWLIQINANPCLQISCPLLSRIIPIMVEHTLRLGLDPLILPPTHYPQSKRYYLSDNFLQNLKYEIIFDELQHQPQHQHQSPNQLTYDFDFDEPEDEYEDEGNDIDLSKLLD